jgi:hypothetical protein
MIIRKKRQLDNKIGVSKKENDRLLDVVKTHRHEADLSQKEARRLVFENSRFKSFVYDKEKKLTKDLEACEVKFAKIKERFVKTSNQVIQMRIKNDAIKLDMGLKKAEAELKREGMKREIAQLAIERDSCWAEEKMRANKQKSDLAIKHMEARLASVQSKKDAASVLKAREIQQKQDVFEKRKQKASYFTSNMVSNLIFLYF